MTPGQHRLRLQSMLRAMTEVVVPALDPEDQLAKDQAGIVVGNLKILMDQSEKVYDFLLVELREYTRLVQALIPLVRDDAVRTHASRAVSEADPVVSLAIPAQSRLQDLVIEAKRAANGSLEEILERGTPSDRASAISLVLRQSERQVLRERTWLRSSGFDPWRDQLPCIETLLDSEPEPGD